jgi:hypothetical protein
VHHASRRDRGGRRPQGLPQHLATEDLRAADVLTLPAEKIDLEPLKLEDL